MRDPVQDPERAHDRAGGEDERDRDGERDAEDREEDQQCDRDRYALALLQVLAEDRVEIVLDRACARDIGVTDIVRRAERLQEGLGVLLRLRHVERGDDIAEDDVPAGRQKLRRLTARNGAGCLVDKLLKACELRRRARAGELEHDRERAVGAVAEVLLERGPDALRVRAGDVEGVGEERGELRARESAGQEDDDPGPEQGATMAQDESGPARHDCNATRRGTVNSP